MFAAVVVCLFFFGLCCYHFELAKFFTYNYVPSVIQNHEHLYISLGKAIWFCNGIKVAQHDELETVFFAFSWHSQHKHHNTKLIESLICGIFSVVLLNSVVHCFVYSKTIILRQLVEHCCFIGWVTFVEILNCDIFCERKTIAYVKTPTKQ